MPASRFDWERVIKRVRLPMGVKGTALILATYADPDGRRVHPGNDRLCRVTGMSDKTVRRHIGLLRETGLLMKTRHGNRHIGQANEYQLSVPADIVAWLPMLDPTELIALPGRDAYRSLVTGRDVDEHVDSAGIPADRRRFLPVTGVPSTGHQCPCLPVTGDRPPTHYQPPPNNSAWLEKSASDCVCTTREEAVGT